jgi:hypothetical protein
MTKEWGELNINWHLEAFGAFYTPFWAAYDIKQLNKTAYHFSVSLILIPFFIILNFFK